MDNQYTTTYPGLTQRHTVYSVAAEITMSFSLMIRYGQTTEKHMLDDYSRIARALYDKKKLGHSFRETWKKSAPNLRYKGVYNDATLPIAAYAALVKNRNYEFDRIASPLKEKGFNCDRIYERGMKAKDQRVNPWTWNSLRDIDAKQAQIKYKAEWDTYFAPKYQEQYVDQDIPF